LIAVISKLDHSRWIMASTSQRNNVP